jgi:RHH-type proline utilization regulon transcriptional repressor/proline dehydrogenase/delta 1-pyrroline-5-carboxylate dehydrogenase
VENEKDRERLRASAGSYAWAWQTHFSREHDPSRVHGETNRFRYRPCGPVMLCVDEESSPVAVAQIILATATTRTPLQVSLTSPSDWLWLQELGLQLLVEDESERLGRIAAGSEAFERLRLLKPPSGQLRHAANRGLLNIVDMPVLANGRLELRYYLREQVVSQTVHRHGNLTTI